MKSTIYALGVAFGLAGCISAPQTRTDINGDCNAVGSNNSINCTWSRAEFTEALGQSLIAQMPDKLKLVNLVTIGGDLDQKVGDQASKYLVSKGYNIRRSVIGMMAPPPDHPFVLQVGGREYNLQIAPSAR